VITFWVLGILLVTLFVLWVVVVILDSKDKSRARRAEQAGDEAVDGYRQAMKEARARGVMRFKIDMIKDGYGQFRILLWDATPFMDSQVEGVLVPYYIAAGTTQEEAEKDMAQYIKDWAERVRTANGNADFQVVDEAYIDHSGADESPWVSPEDGLEWKK
jgi:hypothetical protein